MKRYIPRWQDELPYKADRPQSWHMQNEINDLRQYIEELEEKSSSFKLNTEQTVAVSTDEYWIRTGPHTPRGVKVQLLGQGGVATYSEYHGDPFFTHWHPLPKRPPE